ncbi:hypothetical protein N7481_008426 [Penicillium waksmanii]|uniref:uncharacterized protein n=1 Tax=Penicillium waksmanii TaxID=69791 RepID=UPI002548F839|nr:uncharacterized protein N7481_008426 [Penicillium waksmanii]KAJ5981128.1 hypothetical protein N7481_008426 [Penicillium waksmanii]
MAKNKKGKKSRNQNDNPPDARFMQTPFTDREETTEQEGIPPHDEPGEEFAPGASDTDGHDSDADNGSENEGPPVEDKPPPLKKWVKEVIKRETSGEKAQSIENFFNSEEPDASACKPFFERLNQHIRAANQEHGAIDLDEGTVPVGSYDPIADTCRRMVLAKKDSPEEAWDAFHRTRDLLKKINRRYRLPRTWNFHPSWCESICGPDPTMHGQSDEDFETSGDESQAAGDTRGDLHSTDGLGDSDDSEAESVRPTGLDSLESRAMKEQRRHSGGKVLFWWPKGTGSQTFVRYGDRSAPIYRIRAGSHEMYDQKRVEKVLTTKTRGSQKVDLIKNGIPCEEWKFGRQHVEDIRGVGWKVEDDDEVGIDPLSFIRPVPNSVYPQTRAWVKWKDGKFTLEGRQFIRRITNGSSLQGDQVIFQKAEDLETAYRLRHGWEQTDSEIDLDDVRPSKRYGHAKIKSEIETDTDSDDGYSLRYTNQRKKASSDFRSPSWQSSSSF